MHVFYFIPPDEHFELLKQTAGAWSVPVGLSFRRFSPSGFKPGFEACNWNEELAIKYQDGGYSEIYLSTNNSHPEDIQDWDYPDRELHDLIIIQGGRVQGDELEQSYLRAFAKQSNCVPFYRKIRRTLKNGMEQGLYAGRHYYKDTLYSAAATGMTMVNKLGGTRFTQEEP